MPPAVSIIVPTYNRCARLERLLRALDQLSGPTSFEVVVAVDGSTDGTQQMLAALSMSYPLRVIEQVNQGPAAARNNAMRVASAAVLLFLDDDVVPVPGMIERHLAIHARDPRAVVTGPMSPPPGLVMEHWLFWEAITLQKQYDAMVSGKWAPTARQFYTANASLRRDQAIAAGGFDVSFTRAEDVEFAFRLAARGARFYFEPDAVVLHEPDRTFASWLRVPFEYGRFDVRMQRECGLPWLIELARTEFRGRHVLNRTVPRIAVGHRLRMRLVTGLFGGLVTRGGRILPRRALMALCSALFTLQYWEGIAQATGLGPDVWRGPVGETTRPPTADPSAERAA